MSKMTLPDGFVFAMNRIFGVGISLDNSGERIAVHFQNKTRLLHPDDCNDLGNYLIQADKILKHNQTINEKLSGK